MVRIPSPARRFRRASCYERLQKPLAYKIFHPFTKLKRVQARAGAHSLPQAGPKAAPLPPRSGMVKSGCCVVYESRPYSKADALRHGRWWIGLLVREIAFLRATAILACRLPRGPCGRHARTCPYRITTKARAAAARDPVFGVILEIFGRYNMILAVIRRSTFATSGLALDQKLIL